MPITDTALKERIFNARKAVDDYRAAHTKLYDKGWHKGIPEEHTPLLHAMLTAFKGLGFNSLREFWDASELLNIQELGFTDREDFEARATLSDREALRSKWQ